MGEEARAHNVRLKYDVHWQTGRLADCFRENWIVPGSRVVAVAGFKGAT